MRNRYFAFFVFSILYAFYILPFLNNIVFDAVIHFSVSENFVKGYPFQFNQNGETVLASTSPFWTMILILCFKFAEYKAVLLLKAIIILAWGGTTYFIYRTAKDIWKLPQIPLYALLLLWILNVSVLKNSLGGMENILSAFQLILIYHLLCRSQGALHYNYIITTGILTGWALLTRPEVGFLCFLITIIYLLRFLLNKQVKSLKILGCFTIVILCTLIILLPWYYYQYSVTGKIISDSSYSRIFSGRWNSIVIIPGTIFLHPYLLSVLFTAFLPVTFGSLYYIKYIRTFFRKLKETGIFYLFEKFNITTSVIILLVGFILYTFIVGGDQIGRYFVPFYPFFFIIGISGLTLLYNDLKPVSISWSRLFIIGTVLFLLSVNIYDYYRRVLLGTEMESNVSEMINSPGQRHDYTLYFLRGLKYKDSDTIKFALKEIQFRYFIDERIQVESLDGRTSSKIFKYLDRNGFPDFEKYLLNEKPDVVEVGGWDKMINYRAWYMKMFTFGKKDNIISLWDRKISNMQMGDSFYWEGNKVSFYLPGLVRIDWNN